ncbi:E3 ubiquitin-protein ligase [Rhynchospora pubera]|uniref:E3 ubiquitin-protein ligase n=1 Tax=Rhynchospora pubera TaxID=906938 RepID=A0AAV8HBL1_9POAL|nr:E3 ubiquitin-protein ligase [Rhynchospora pubera]
MSRNNRRNGRLELKLNLSPPVRGDSSRRMHRVEQEEEEDSSSPSSCVSSENEQGSPEAASMVLAACPCCFMYVMLSEADPRCPQCKRPVILDFLRGNGGNNGNNGNNSRRG